MALTKEQKQQAFAELGRFIEEIKDEKGSMMPIMQQAQKLFGCVSLEVQEFISQKTGASVAELYGIATFYAQFTLESVAAVCGAPEYKKRVFFSPNAEKPLLTLNLAAGENPLAAAQQFLNFMQSAK